MNCDGPVFGAEAFWDQGLDWLSTQFLTEFRTAFRSASWQNDFPRRVDDDHGIRSRIQKDAEIRLNPVGRFTFARRFGRS